MPTYSSGSTGPACAGAKRGLDPAEMVDGARYPLQHLHAPQGRAFLRECRRDFVRHGLCALPGFVRPAALALMAGEAASIRHEAWFCDSVHNAYLGKPSPGPKQPFAVNHQEVTSVGSIAYDRLGDDSHLVALYRWPPLKELVRGVLAKPRLHYFADPLGACSINVFEAGGRHGWHFDEAEFTVTLMLQAPKAGGAFEYVSGLRGHPDEHAEVEKVLRGDRSRVSELAFVEGTLLVFGGSATLHRVTEVAGATARLVPVFCYSEDARATNSKAVRRLFWGRSE